MISYLLKRTSQSIMVLFIVSSGCFILMHMMPGTQFTHIETSLADRLNTAKLEHMYGFDKPVLTQYVDWLKGIVHGHFIGAAKWGFATPVNIWPYVWNDVVLVGLAWVISLLISIPWGIYNSQHPYGASDTLGNLFAYIGFSIPAFVLGFFFQGFFAIEMGWFPPSSMYDPGHGGEFMNLLPHLVLPVTVLTFGFLVTYMKYTRNSFIEVLPGDYVRTGRAKGASQKRIIYRHVLRNALVPIITVLSMDVKNVLGGAAVVEMVFNWPGMGVLLVGSAQTRHYDIVLAIVMVIAVIVVVSNWIADILYMIVDPRIRHGSGI